MSNNKIDELRGLSTVRVAKEFLLKKLKENRKVHKKTYEKAMVAWHVKVLETIKKELKKVKSDKTYHPNVRVPSPANHTEDYCRVIDILEASLDSEFVLSNVEFGQYVQDEWHWKEAFVTTVSGCYDYK